MVKPSRGTRAISAPMFWGSILPLRRILMADALAVHARIIIVTDDNYVMAQGCSSNYHWRSRMGALRAYRRSKLGNFWIARELQKRHPHYNVFIVHPGAVATDLRGNGLLPAWLNRFLCDIPQRKCAERRHAAEVCAAQKFQDLSSRMAAIITTCMANVSLIMPTPPPMMRRRRAYGRDAMK